MDALTAFAKREEFVMQATRELARWSAEVPKITSEVALARARDGIYDVVACMVAGAGDAGSARVRAAIAPYGSGPATVIGARGGASAPWAALANGMAAHALDFDDNYIPAYTHATAVLMPALLAVAEEIDASGEQLIDAYIVGLEMHCAIGRGVNRAHYDKGWHGTSTVGCIGTAAACGRLLGLDADQMTQAISLGVSMASGPKVQFGTMAKPFHAGMGAKNAVLAAQLAANGFEARDIALEGELGFLDLYGGDGAMGWDHIVPKLGDPLAIEEFGLAPKLYPCCGSTHRVLDAVLALQKAHDIAADDVQKVDTKVGFGNQRNLMYDDPQQEMEGRFSMNYCVAVALRYGRVSLSDFTPDAVHRPEVRELLPRVTMEAYPQDAEGPDPASRLPHDVAITLKDGRRLTDSVHWARGTIHNPFDQADQAAKFRDCCEGFLSPDDFEAAQQALVNVSELPSVRDLTRHLVFEAGADNGERFARRYAHAAQ
jgi:2-methylcitrate dehydratase PrpD